VLEQREAMISSEHGRAWACTSGYPGSPNLDKFFISWHGHVRSVIWYWRQLELTRWVQIIHALLESWGGSVHKSGVVKSADGAGRVATAFETNRTQDCRCKQNFLRGQVSELSFAINI
jgi:hypothetical protein